MARRDPAGGKAAGDTECHLVKLGTLPLALEGHQILLTGAIGDEAGRWLMDTGAEESMIPRPTAERAHLTVREMPSRMLEGIGGTVAMGVAQIDLRLGSWGAHDVPMVVAGNHGLGREPDQGQEDVIGVIGEPFFAAFDVEINLPERQATLFRAKNCDPDYPLAYWADQVVQVPLLHPVNRKDARIEVRVQINGQDMRALLDTGASVSLLSSRAAYHLGLHPDAADVETGGQIKGLGDAAVASYIAPIDSFSIGEETIKNTRLRVGPVGFQECDMLLGADFLQAHRVLVAHSQRQLYLSYVSGPVFDVRPPPSPPSGS